MKSNWLIKSLEEASERAKKLPKWAVEINAAWEAQYYPNKYTDERFTVPDQIQDENTGARKRSV